MPTNLTQTLKTARNKKQLTQKQVAQQAGVSTNWYAQYERGEQMSSFKTTRKIFNVLGLKMPPPFD